MTTKLATLFFICSFILVHQATAAAPTNEELARRVDLLSEEVQKMKMDDSGEVTEDGNRYGLGPYASRVYRKDKGVSLGGYGEMLYQNFAGNRESGAQASSTDQIDFLRSVVYLGYRFNEKFLLNTELEFEHASTGSGGEVSVEFAYLDYFIHPAFNLRAGLVLLPVGILNELHEPTTFLTARRTETESTILPTTWRENGFGFFGDAGPVTYRAYLVNGLNSNGFTSASLRSGRQKGVNSKVSDGNWAWVARVDYTQLQGLLAGLSTYQGDSGFYPTTSPGFVVPRIKTRIYDVHADWKWRGLQMRALAVMTTLGSVRELNQAKGLTGSSSVGQRLWGWYAQAGYDLASVTRLGFSLTPFFQYERIRTQDDVPSGFTVSGANSASILTYGVSVKPIEAIAVKVDYQDYRREDKSGVDQLNVALGYSF